MAALALYAGSGASWWLFAVLFLASDLSMPACWKGPRLGASVYNAFHITPWPLAPLVGGGYLSDAVLTPGLGLTWLAHLGRIGRD